MKWFWFALAFGLGPHSICQSKDVGFPDVGFFLKTQIVDGGKSGGYQLEFYLCQIGRDDFASGECVRLSSCRYGNQQMDAEIAKIQDADVRSEFELLTSSSYQSRIKSTQYLPELLTLLKTLSVGKECVLVKSVSVESDHQISVQMDFPRSRP